MTCRVGTSGSTSTFSLREGRADGGYTVLTWPTFGGTDVALFLNMSLPGATGDAIRTEGVPPGSVACHRQGGDKAGACSSGLENPGRNVPPPGHPHYPGDDIAKLRTEYDVEEANRLLDSVFPDRDDEGFRLSNGERIVMKRHGAHGRIRPVARCRSTVVGRTRLGGSRRQGRMWTRRHAVSTSTAGGRTSGRCWYGTMTRRPRPSTEFHTRAHL